MKFSTNAVLCLFTASAYATAIDPRDLASVKQVLATVQSGIDALTSAAQGFDGSIQPVVDSSNKLVDSINAGTDAIKALDILKSGDAFGLLSPVKELQQHAQSLDDEFKARVSTIEQAKGCATSRTQLDKIATAAKSLIDTLVSKVPTVLQSVAKDQANKINGVLADAQANLAADKCVDA